LGICDYRQARAYESRSKRGRRTLIEHHAPLDCAVSTFLAKAHVTGRHDEVSPVSHTIRDDVARGTASAAIDVSRQLAVYDLQYQK
jgi:hypothetical protein